MKNIIVFNYIINLIINLKILYYNNNNDNNNNNLAYYVRNYMVENDIL